MAVKKIIKEIQHLNRKEKARLLRFLEAELIKKDRREEDPMEDFIGSIKKLSKSSKGASGYEKDLYGDPSNY
ncbi:hypothetical protein MHOCP_07650 [Moorella humiferrea]|uniref:Uncharacterized protein n=1 Tax=Neomoorella humiferrea TaxID=676965 RepID=A0A2T0AN36_9FIRM|nr:hypothetical protein [Moorella humiferrea]PRR70278.1 hypothetical protein MOHU_20690 [Moorella humiferrea]